MTEAAIREMLAGGSPYGHGFANPYPDAPFAYGPLALLWYLPGLDRPRSMELLASLFILGLLALRGRPLGLAIYAVTPAFVVWATDGSNDTTAACSSWWHSWPLFAGRSLGRSCWPSPLPCEPYALAWLPGLFAYAGSVGPLVAFLVATAVAWPAGGSTTWVPDSLLWSFRRAGQDPRPALLLAGLQSGRPGVQCPSQPGKACASAPASCWP